MESIKNIGREEHGKYTDFRIPGLAATKDGILLRCYECRKSCSDWAAIDIALDRSKDKGESWERILLIDGGGQTLNNPVLIVGEDRVIFLYCKNYKEIWQAVSFDDGKCFGKPTRVDFEPSADFFYNVVAVGPGHGIAHRGALIVPVWFAYDGKNEKSHHPSFISTLYSKDNGQTWRIGEIIFKDRLNDPSECALAVTAENEVLISIRHEGIPKLRALATSTDGISGWKELHYADNLADPICMAGMTSRQGRIYHSNCDCADSRKNLTVTVSDDGFQSCRKVMISENGGYSDIALLDGEICIFHEARREDGSTGLFFQKIPSDLLTAQ
ncbi:MAG: exo-alpha-sialidase [Eubacteriales bacterium]